MSCNNCKIEMFQILKIPGAQNNLYVWEDGVHMADAVIKINV